MCEKCPYCDIVDVELDCVRCGVIYPTDEQFDIFEEFGLDVFNLKDWGVRICIPCHYAYRAKVLEKQKEYDSLPLFKRILRRLRGVFYEK